MTAIRLPLTYAGTSLFEIDLSRVADRVPPPLSPIEVRPGVGLVSLTVCAVADGGVHGEHGPLPAYDEAVFSIHVEPDLADGVPDMSLLVLTFGATEPRALRANADHHDLDVWERPLQVEVDAAHHRVRVADDAGPIATVGCEHPRPRYAERPATLQVYTATDRGVRRYDERFEARSFRHQRRDPCAELHDHAFFRGVRVADLSRPFLQWLCEPGQPVVQIATVPTRPVRSAP